MFHIPYETAGFSAGFPGQGRLYCSWPALLHSAVMLSGSTAGAGTFGTSWLPGIALEYLWRAALVGANLKQQRGTCPLLQTDQYWGLDRSEKGAVSFFLGQVSAKHFAENLLNSSIFTRVDEALEVAGMPVTGRRPDFYGYSPAGGVFATEAKGRTGMWNIKLMRDAKAQATLLPPVLGSGTHHSIAHVAYFERFEWKARLEDPPRPHWGEDGPSVAAVVYAYYSPLAALLQEREGQPAQLEGAEYAMAELPEVDLRVGLRQDLFAVVSNLDVSPERRGAELKTLLAESGHLTEEGILTGKVAQERVRSEVDSGRSVGADGVLLEAGDAWRSEVMLLEPRERPKFERG